MFNPPLRPRQYTNFPTNRISKKEKSSCCHENFSFFERFYLFLCIQTLSRGLEARRRLHLCADLFCAEVAQTAE